MMVGMDALPVAFTATRTSLQRVAVHVVARRRHLLSGRFGLRATPGGFGAPAAGAEHEVLRTSGAWLVREQAGTVSRSSALDLRTASLADAAAFAEVDLDGGWSVGADTPALGDPAEPLGVDPAAATALGAWYAFGAVVLDAAVGSLGPAATPSVAQLWPEHFDLGCDVEAAPDQRVNLGASPGDEHEPEPYLYVGPWGSPRPGPDGYWNAPFGAVLGYGALAAADDAGAAALAFLQEGLARLMASASSS